MLPGNCKDDSKLIDNAGAIAGDESQDIKHTPAGGTLKGDRGYIDIKTREWGIKAKARGVYSSNIYKTVSDPEKCAGLGIPVCTATRSGWDNCMSRITQDELDVARAEYLGTFEDVELAQKKFRVLELVKLYNRFKKFARGYKGVRGAEHPPLISASCECRMLLRQIADEVGEDARLEAVAKSGSGPVPAMSPDLLRELAFLIAGELKPEKVGKVREPLIDKLVMYGTPVSDDVREPESGVPL